MTIVREDVVADWEGCRTNLYWSANHEIGTWKRHGQALIEYASGDENKAFNILLDIQDQDDGVQEGYKNCRESDKTKFWSLAQSVYSVAGPKRDA